MRSLAGIFLFCLGFSGCGAEPGRGDAAPPEAGPRADGSAPDGAARPDGAPPDAATPSADAAPRADAVAGAAQRFLALGDSYTIGESVPAGERFPVVLAARLNAEGPPPLEAPEIIARTGWSTAQLAAAVASAAPAGPYALVTLLVGVNDQFRGGSAEAYGPEIRRMLGTAIDLAGAPCGVVMVSIPDYGQTPFGSFDAERIAAGIDAFNAQGRAAAAERGVAFVEITDISRRGLAEPGLVARDGLHPSGVQYVEWVERILPAAQAARICPRPAR